LLLGGRYGTVSAADYETAAADPNANGAHAAGDVWAAAEKELGQLIPIVTRELSAWAQAPPSFEITGDFAACDKIDGETRLIYLYNRGQESAPVLHVFASQPHYSVEVDTLDGSHSIGRVAAADLRTGLKLPAMAQQRLYVVRMRPIRNAHP
jgi:hypothetical protein